MQQEILQLNKERKVTLTAYIQPVGGKFSYIKKRPAVLILPGGGYQYCSEREMDPVAFAYLKAGYQVFILQYSVGKHSVWPNPLEDVEQALALIRNNDQWHVYADKVAVAGFSAGGHLAAAAAVMAKERPNAAILGYAVAGSDVKGCNPSAPDTIPFVDKNTCPCFLFATCSDTLVPVRNSIDFMSALSKAKISFESHIYAYGPHGFSTADSSVHFRNTPISSRAADWVEDSISWLKEIFGDFGDGQMTQPSCQRYTTADYDPTLSADCTLGYLLANPQSKAVLSAVLNQIPEGADISALYQMTLRAILDFVRCPKEQIEALDQQLRKIENS